MSCSSHRTRSLHPTQMHLTFCWGIDLRSSSRIQTASTLVFCAAILRKRDAPVCWVCFWQANMLWIAQCWRSLSYSRKVQIRKNVYHVSSSLSVGFCHFASRAIPYASETHCIVTWKCRLTCTQSSIFLDHTRPRFALTIWKAHHPRVHQHMEWTHSSQCLQKSALKSFFFFFLSWDM